MRRRRGRRFRKTSFRGRGSLLFTIFLLLFLAYGKIVLIIGLTIIAIIAGLILYIHYTSAKQSKNHDFVPPFSGSTFSCNEPLYKEHPQTTKNNNATYSSKSSFITDCEKQYFVAIQEIVGNSYIVQPQINLASVIRKETQSKYRNELFRNIDFGIFDKQYKPLVLIEINDKSHKRLDRQDRDNKVRTICAEAGLPLLSFWTNYDIDKDYIKFRLREHLPNL